MTSSLSGTLPETALVGASIVTRRITIVAVLCSILIVPRRAHSQPGSGTMMSALPASREGTAAASLIRDFNSSRLTAPRWQRWRQLVGPVSVGGVERLDSGSVRVWVRGNVTDAWLGFEIVLSGGGLDRNGVPVFWLGGDPPQSLVIRTDRNREPDTSALIAYMNRVSAANVFSGVVVASRSTCRC